jgi:membrane protease YdiL (CAAX protease family)
VVISGIAFGLAHSGWALFSKRGLEFSLPAVGATSVLGVLLAVIYLVGGRNLGPCRAAHVAINLVIEPWLMLSAVSGRRRA